MLPSYPESLRRAFARNVLRNTLRLARGENLLIDTWSGTLPWALSFDVEARILGSRPLLWVKDEPSYWRGVSEGPASQLGRMGSHELAALAASDAYVCLYGPEDALREEKLPRTATRRIESNNHEMMRVIQKHGIRTVRWDLGRTSALWARRYSVDLGTWRRELIDATMIDPGEMHRDGSRIANRLEHGEEVTITHRNGTNLVLRLDHRRPKLDDGVLDEKAVKAGNMMVVVPTGVVSVTVNELHGEGTFVSNAMGVLYGHGQEIPLASGRWTFRGGALESFVSAKGGERFRRELAQLGNPQVRVGQLSVGLNPRISSIPLLFDQSRGTITFEVGRNVQLGGRSRGPQLIAYLDLTGGDLQIDGEPIVEHGKIVRPG